MGSTNGPLSISTSSYFFALIILFSLKDLCNTNDVEKSGNNKNLEYMNCPAMFGHRLYLLHFPLFCHLQ